MSTGLSGMAIRRIAAYAPPTIVSNDDIAERLRGERTSYQEHLQRALTEEESKRFETSDRWIRRFIGFRARRFVAPGVGTIDLAIAAGRLLQQQSDWHPATIDGIVFATVSPSYRHSPPDAALFQDALGIPAMVHGQPHDILGLDVRLACPSWVAALRICYGLIRSGLAKRILLVGADAMSTTINWWDRAFATVLGDAGTVTELVAVPEAEDWFSPERFWGALDGSHSDVIITPRGGSRQPIQSSDEVNTREHFLTMDGRRVKEEIVPLVGGPAIQAALRKAKLTLGHLDLATLHEANLTLNADILKTWQAGGFRGTVLNADGAFGNTTSASIPLALALNGSALTVGSTFALVGFGGGYSMATAIGTIKHPITCLTNV